MHPIATRSPPSPSPPVAQAVEASVPATPAPGDSFAERALQLVEFLADCRDATGGTRQREHELAQWIARWREAPLHRRGGQQHFVAEELGIIMRALCGPALGAARRLPAESSQTLRWLLARSLSDTS